MVDWATTAPRLTLLARGPESDRRAAGQSTGMGLLGQTAHPASSSIQLTAVAATGPRATKAAHYLQCRLAGGRTENSRKLTEVAARRA